MKKTFFVAAIMALTCASSYLAHSVTNKSNDASDLLLMNAEALTDDENNGYLYVVDVKYDWGWGCNCAGSGTAQCC